MKERNELIQIKPISQLLNTGEVEYTYTLDNYIAKDLRLIDEEIKQLKQKQDDIKAAILKEMEAQEIKQINDEINKVKVTYIEPTEKEYFNKEILRQKDSNLYDECIEFKPVKASIRITIK